jgi:hypothetical protein
MPILDPYPSTPTNAYANAKAVPSKFWGAPVLANDDGTVWCPGYSGDTYSKRLWSYVTIAVPYNAPSLPQTPGICEVTCVKMRDVDKKKKKGSDGARITLAGLEPAEVDLKNKIWTPQQLVELDILRDIIFPGPQKVTTTTQDLTLHLATTVQPRGVTIVDDGKGGFANRRDFVVATTIPSEPFKSGKKTTTTKMVTTPQPFDVLHPVLDREGVNSLIFVRTEGPVPGPERNTMIFTFKAIQHSLPAKGVNSTTTPSGSKSTAPLRSTLEDGVGQPPGNNPENLGPG